MKVFELWDKINEKKKAALENKRNTVLKKTIDALDVLANQYQISEAYIFGSVIQSGKFGNYSDVDIAVKGLNKFLQYQFIANLSSIIERNVDVILLEDKCHITDIIIQEGIKWKKKD